MKARRFGQRQAVLMLATIAVVAVAYNAVRAWEYELVPVDAGDESTQPAESMNQLDPTPNQPFNFTGYGSGGAESVDGAQLGASFTDYGSGGAAEPIDGWRAGTDQRVANETGYRSGGVQHIPNLKGYGSSGAQYIPTAANQNTSLDDAIGTDWLSSSDNSPQLPSPAATQPDANLKDYGSVDSQSIDGWPAAIASDAHSKVYGSGLRYMLTAANRSVRLDEVFSSRLPASPDTRRALNLQIQPLLKHNRTYMNVYFCAAYLVVVVLAPFGIIAALNCRIISAMRAASRQRAQLRLEGHFVARRRAMSRDMHSLPDNFLNI